MDGKGKDVRVAPTPKFESKPHLFIEVELLVRYISSVVWKKMLEYHRHQILSQNPSIYRGRVTCEIYFVSCLEKNKKRANFENITDVEVFKQYAERWRERERV